ncbi:MAG: prolipoprotein diacylglyceryl transferase [Candidatus Margulisbacteria bacterium]|jgi:phosphatidylglycerol:prolipoprotein diacylglycerol transferase|nr:prolipoprotein diacylglyceryl transferase [Candidatus Margulisiibacteriota bacterium]
MSGINKIGPTRPSLPRRVWQTTKAAVKNSFYLLPGLLIINYYAQPRLEQGLPLTRIGTSLEVGNIYPHMVGWGIWLAFSLAVKSSLNKGIKATTASLAFLSTTAVGIAGSIGLHLAQHPQAINNLGHDLGTWYGGLLGGTGWLFAFGKITKTPVLKLYDALTPAALIGLGIGRLGCWSAGCCSGEIFGLPTEAVSSAVDISLGLELTRLSKRLPAGKTFALGLISYSAFRFAIEFARHEPKVLGFMTLAQTISLAVFSGALAYCLGDKKPAETEPSACEPTITEKKSAAKQRLVARIWENVLIVGLHFGMHPFIGLTTGAINLIRLTSEGIKLWLYRRG